MRLPGGDPTQHASHLPMAASESRFAQPAAAGNRCGDFHPP
ncbi:hypothetical protein OCO_32620 [Mycobacterium intracellulare MOTT-02]|uniref:Uncharacterized protein n=2 Tax=Mycobacterium intracellulare TaxID=1767 RepID=H8ITC0_MYCIA|nr:hypothetical protein OCU_32520 [Mycobacterium intracellulare ATCC 13950]AFC49625.1 hypothetical protein OCO_32620 [Mycobacterium intracellulare MOTT-02]AFC54885.1 hypothetical protein OCQ_33730 [Mycobacterium paraintracellulare]AFS15305.1 Shikimate kinase [Mycobacterium intracellulare subsp. intracellulare MTCC 9506]AGP64754.1 hypothetical protein OEM_32190 [Mycobacterium intracellulare subsp. yongonense 05-1390]ARV85192.1 shikimate kinase [Mycobacterium intracellulare subsp. chimaera]ASW8